VLAPILDFTKIRSRASPMVFNRWKLTVDEQSGDDNANDAQDGQELKRLGSSSK
jgi:hypothetical protein